MKNKGRYTIGALLAALLVTAAFPMTAFAGGPGYEEPEETLTEETTEPTPPLTPEGNLTLVDDITTADDGEKQFITVVSKNGNYFYLVIDRSDDGEGNVHFLNLVDEADLLALIEDGEQPAEPAAPLVCTCQEKCGPGAVNISCEVCRTDLNGCTGEEKEPEEPEAEPEKKGNAGAVLALVVILGLGGGGAYYYLKVLKPKQQAKAPDDLEDFDFEDEEDYEDEEVTEDYGEASTEETGGDVE